MLSKILNDAYSFKKRVAKLKENSSYYPEVLTVRFNEQGYRIGDPIPDTLFLSTLVRVKRDEVWYKVHCVQSASLNTPSAAHHCYALFMKDVHKIQHLFIPSGEYSDIDPLQISEEDRILELLRPK